MVYCIAVYSFFVLDGEAVLPPLMFFFAGGPSTAHVFFVAALVTCLVFQSSGRSTAHVSHAKSRDPILVQSFSINSDVVASCSS